MLVIIHCCYVYKQRAGGDSVRQKAINSPGLEEAETSFENQQELSCIPMVSADDGKGESYILQNLATGNEEKERSSDLHGPRPHNN